MSDTIRKITERLRATLESAQAGEGELKWLERFPRACCNFTSNLLLLELHDAKISPLRRMIGTITDDGGSDLENHVWVIADGTIVDITADNFGLEKVVVTKTSEWHESLSEIGPFIERIDLEQGISSAELDRVRELYEGTLAVLAPVSYTHLTLPTKA